MTKDNEAVITREAAWALSDAAYLNSKSLVDAAAVLHSAGCFGPALSLAISAREEMGKFYMALLVAVGRTSPAKFEAFRRQHRAKQAFGALASLVGRVIDLARSPFAEAVDVRGVPPDQVLDVLNERLVAAAKAAAIADDAIAHLVKESEAALDGAHERERWRGLYADLSNVDGEWQITTPADVTAEEAANEIERARAHFDFVAAATQRVQIDPAARSLTLQPDEFREKLGAFVLSLFGPEDAPEVAV